MTGGIEIGLSQELSPEERLEQIEEQLQRLDHIQEQLVVMQADVTMAINYMRAIAQTLLSKDHLAKLHMQIEKWKTTQP